MTYLFCHCDGPEPPCSSSRLVLSDVYWGALCEVLCQPHTPEGCVTEPPADHGGTWASAILVVKSIKNISVRPPPAYSRVGEERLYAF